LHQSHGCFEKKRTPATLKISSVTDLNRRTNFSQTKTVFKWASIIGFNSLIIALAETKNG
jgi:hypothetical protein